MTDKLPHCNKVMIGSEVFGLMQLEGKHCSDLIAGSRDAKEATELFAQALEALATLFRRLRYRVKYEDVHASNFAEISVGH